MLPPLAHRCRRSGGQIIGCLCSWLYEGRIYLREVPPRPLLEQQITPIPYPVAALGDHLRPAVERMADVIGVPCAMAAQSVLATAALASQAHANVHLDGRIYPLSLYLLTVACSGDRKSAVDHVALQAVRDWERQQ